MSEFNVLFSSSVFAYHQNPFQILDFVVMFCLSFFLTLRVGAHNKFVTISCGIPLLWGIWFLVRRITLPFVHFFPNMMSYELPIEAVVYNLFTLLDLWISVQLRLLIGIWVVSFLLDIGIAFLILRFQCYLTRNRFEPNAGHFFSSAKILNS